jgi:hypothetical protein
VQPSIVGEVGSDETLRVLAVTRSTAAFESGAANLEDRRVVRSACARYSDSIEPSPKLSA